METVASVLFFFFDTEFERSLVRIYSWLEQMCGAQRHEGTR